MCAEPVEAPFDEFRAQQSTLAETYWFESVAGMDQFVLSGDECQLGTAGGSRNHEKSIDHCRGVRQCSHHVPQTQQAGQEGRRAGLGKP